MRFTVTLAALVGLSFATCALASPDSLLAPDDPAISSGWRPPPSPTAGLKPFAPVGTKDWIQLNRDVTPAAGDSMGRMPAMGGMGGMSGMGGEPGSGKHPKGGMSGMPGMGGGK